MSASIRTAPAQVGYGGFKSAFAALALVVIMAVTIAVLALGGTKAAPGAATQANPVPAPVYLDRGSRDEMNLNGVKSTHPQDGFGGWGGPRLDNSTGNGGHGTRLAQ